MKEVLKILNKYNSFALFCHISPDADALGSMNALRLTLKKMGKKAYAYCDGKIPHNIAFLKVPLEEKPTKIAKCDVCIMIDCNSLDRVGKFGEYFDAAKIKVNIDHHQDNKYEADHTLSIPGISSTCEIIYEIINSHSKEFFDKDTCDYLYAGMMNDTNCFTRRLSKKTMAIAQKLINFGADYTYIIKKTFSERTMYCE